MKSFSPKSPLATTKAERRRVCALKRKHGQLDMEKADADKKEERDKEKPSDGKTSKNTRKNKKGKYKKG